MKAGKLIGMFILAAVFSLAACAPSTTNTVVVRKQQPNVVVVKKPRRNVVVVNRRPFRPRGRRVVVIR